MPSATATDIAIKVFLLLMEISCSIDDAVLPRPRVLPPRDQDIVRNLRAAISGILQSCKRARRFQLTSVTMTSTSCNRRVNERDRSGGGLQLKRDWSCVI